MAIKPSFKPYYNWNTFNTLEKMADKSFVKYSFKPYYNWNTFNTSKLWNEFDFKMRF